MTALAAGTKAPEVELKTMDGEKFSLQAELAHRPVVLIFFKTSCPTCQYALPMFERLHKAYGQKNVRLLGVSQHAFISRFKRLRPDQRPQHLLGGSGWGDRTHQCGLGQGRLRIDQSQDRGNRQGLASDDLHSWRRGQGFPRRLRLQELGAGRRLKLRNPGSAQRQPAFPARCSIKFQFPGFKEEPAIGRGLFT